MKRNFSFWTLALVLVFAIGILPGTGTGSDSSAQAPDSSQIQRPTAGSASAAGAAVPNYCVALHNIGNMSFGTSNFGRIGVGNEAPSFDCFTGVGIPYWQFPKGATQVYLYKGGIWIGGIVGSDTLVSCGTNINSWSREFNPDMKPAGATVRRSTLDPFSPLYEGAVSEQDFIAHYTDTVALTNLYESFDQITNRVHRPLGLRVEQTSYGWSYGYTADFTLVNLRIRNIGKNFIKQAYVGIYMDQDIGKYPPLGLPPGMDPVPKYVRVGADDFTGYLVAAPDTYDDNPCIYDDTVRVAWAADNDGDGNQANGTFVVPNVLGVRFLNPPTGNEKISYNWWVFNYNTNYDYGPQLRHNFRNMGGGTGTPYGDRNKYAMLSNGEVDVDQALLGLKSDFDPDMVVPNQDIVRLVARSGDNSYLLSIGPYDLSPGDEVVVPFAFVGGENFHQDVDNYFYNIGWRYSPKSYYDGLNFAGLAKNAAWASKVFDNPGVDTDSDGYAGKFHVCVVDSERVDGHWVPLATDTIYYEGDGAPDWKAASPPPAPNVWVSPKLDGLKVRWNGYRSETTKDYLTGEFDFEGYRLYLGRDDREGSFALMAAYDREDFDVYFFNSKKKPKPGWELQGSPVTLRQLRCRFSKNSEGCEDTTFNPLLFPIDQPWRSAIYLDSIFYFTTHEANAFKFGVTTPIRKRFPDAPKPVDPSNPTLADLTDDGYLKYWEYECDINQLLPTVSYFVNVTSFDYGSPKQGLLPLETSKALHPQSAFPYADANQLSGDLPPVYIYPNPYRIDESYRARGYEGYGQLDKADNRVRAINFVNLPAHCTIRILSLDGDLVRQIDHNVDPSDPKSTHDKWDLISRNTQAVVSGIYYWTVEGPDGRVQIGKLVIIM